MMCKAEQLCFLTCGKNSSFDVASVISQTMATNKEENVDSLDQEFNSFIDVETRVTDIDKDHDTKKIGGSTNLPLSHRFQHLSYTLQVSTTTSANHSFKNVLDAHFICMKEQAIGVVADVGANAGLLAHEPIPNSMRVEGTRRG